MKWRRDPPPHDAGVQILAVFSDYLENEAVVVEWRETRLDKGWSLTVSGEGYTGAPIETDDPMRWMMVSDLFEAADGS